MIYVLVTFAASCGFVSMAIDFGRVELDKSQLQLAADAAARNGAMGLPTNAQVNNAINAAKANIVEGAPVAVLASDVQVGIWNAGSSTFTVTNSSPNAVRVTAHLSAARGTAVPTVFASILGFSSCDLHATSVATVVAPVTTNVQVPGLADPWLAGMPNGTTANYYASFGDAAPHNSPVAIPLGTLVQGQSLNFQFNGTVSNWSGANAYGCDGNAGYVSDNWWAAANGDAEHGIGNVTAPIAAVIGVFLDNSQPDSSAAPAALDFSTTASRNFTSLSPGLKQPFFIGDGQTDSGVSQGFVVPQGATRLYVGIMDFQQWSDNSGVMTTTVTSTPKVTLVN
jgi:Flp pilus assembly protein TadG